MHRWWQMEEDVDKVIRLGRVLHDAHPDSRLVAVGQSTAWVVYAAGEIRAAMGQAPDTAYLAFTGSFMRHLRDTAEGPVYRVDTPDYPRENRLKDYFDYLAASEAAPGATTALFNAAARQSIYVDMVVEGLGYASFLHMFLKAAGNKMPEGAAFHVFQPPYCENVAPAAFSVETEAQNFVRVPVSVTGDQDVNALGYIAGLTGEADVSEISDRLVPTFDISKYGSGHLRHSPNDANVAAIKAAIDHGITRDLNRGLVRNLTRTGP